MSRHPIPSFETEYPCLCRLARPLHHLSFRRLIPSSHSVVFYLGPSLSIPPI